MEKFGIDNLKAVVKFALDFTAQTAIALADGKFQWTDSFGFVGELVQLPAVIKSFPAIKQEIDDLSADEKTELYKYITDNFDLPNHEVALAIESSVQFALSAAALYEQFKAIKK